MRGNLLERIFQMFNATGSFVVSGFEWDPFFYDLKCSTIEFTCRKDCRLNIADIKKWAKVGENKCQQVNFYRAFLFVY